MPKEELSKYRNKAWNEWKMKKKRVMHMRDTERERASARVSGVREINRAKHLLIFWRSPLSNACLCVLPVLQTRLFIFHTGREGALGHVPETS